MSISSIISLGYGSWGSPSLVIELGYQAGAAPPTPPPNLPGTGDGSAKKREQQLYDLSLRFLLLAD